MGEKDGIAKGKKTKRKVLLKMGRVKSEIMIEGRANGEEECGEGDEMETIRVFV